MTGLNLRQRIWQLVARLITRESVADWLFLRAIRTPYNHIRSADGREVYMLRYWLFNPYPASGETKRWSLLPSVRIHWIMRADQDRHLHDHPWNARTVVLKGWYREERIEHPGMSYWRTSGYTGRLLFGQYHRIAEVSPGGVVTLFITWRYQGTWGFLVNGVKVPWREYLGIDEPKPTETTP
jgi:hypothetical protein